MNKAKQLDHQDPLKEFRSRFFHGDDNLIYLDGNSLGKLPAASQKRIQELTEKEWGTRLIRGWNDGWIELNQRIGQKVARLIGAKPHEVILTDSTSLNLFKLAHAALTFQPENRNEIVSDDLNFPSDLYTLQGLNKTFHDRYQIRLAKSRDGIRIDPQELASILGSKTALLTLSHVCFKSAFMYPMDQITHMAHEAGAMMIWDLSHAVGAVPVNLQAVQADMAVGCTYKYLNGGPGSVAFLYVREDLQEKLSNPIWAWLADDKPFDFSLDFKPASGIRKFATSTPPVLSMAAVEPGVDLLLEAGMETIRQKSIRLSTYLLELFEEKLAPLGFTLGTPGNAEDRGSHISIRHPEGYGIAQALIHPAKGEPIVIPDFREPDYIRLGLTPLYTRFEDVYIAVDRIQKIVNDKEFMNFSDQKNTDIVT